MNMKIVWIVDDDQMQLEALSRILKKSNYEVHEYTDLIMLMKDI